MNNISSRFRLFVMVAVTLTGTGFGALTGLFYSGQYWWAGMITGGLSSPALAWLYLLTLSTLPGSMNRSLAWLLGTAVAIGCGLVCTLLAHGMMWLLTAGFGPATDYRELDLRGIGLVVGLVIGVLAGFVVGGICSLIYVYLPKEPTR
jgi:hypothetical protein